MAQYEHGKYDQDVYARSTTMVIFEQTLRDLLIDTNLVGSRVFLMRAPQVPASKQQIPYFVFLPVAPFPLITQTGPLNIIQRDYQVSIFDTSQTRALAIADSLRTDLDTFTGPYENVQFDSCFYMLQTWNWEHETKLFNVIQEYRIAFHYLPNPPVVTTATQPVVLPEGADAL